MLLFAYGDIFGFYRTGLIEGIIAGKVSGFQINQGFLVGSSLYIAIPCLMVFLSLVLRPDVNRWANTELRVGTDNSDNLLGTERYF